MGLPGSALGSVIAQCLCAAALVAVVVRGARTQGTTLLPDLPGIRAAGRASVPLVIRNLTMRVALLATTYAISDISGVEQATNLAAHQIAFTLWTFLAFALDAIAIAAQALTGRSLGAGDIDGTRAITLRMIWWGVWSGVATGVGLAAASPWIGRLFTSDPEVQRLLATILLIAALGQPVTGVVFVLDGVLIGAGDGRFLALASTLTLLVYAPVVLAWHPSAAAVWALFAGLFMLARLVLLTARASGDRWLVAGV
jgi:putative MATE family efflux protein